MFGHSMGPSRGENYSDSQGAASLTGLQFVARALPLLWLLAVLGIIGGYLWSGGRAHDK
jgi:hypothetical protein